MTQDLSHMWWTPTGFRRWLSDELTLHVTQYTPASGWAAHVVVSDGYEDGCRRYRGIDLARDMSLPEALRCCERFAGVHAFVHFWVLALHDCPVRKRLREQLDADNRLEHQHACAAEANQFWRGGKP